VRVGNPTAVGTYEAFGIAKGTARNDEDGKHLGDALLPDSTCRSVL
jgi:hypothetical protein